MIAIKFCGLACTSSIETARKLKADYAGFVFYPPSPRHITPQAAAGLKSYAGSMRTVAVVVDADNDLLEKIHSHLAPDFWQLHGNETPKRAQEIRNNFGGSVIRALRVHDSDDVAAARTWFDTADMLLFDAKPPAAALPGGNGLAFDWELLAGRDFPLPWMLSGGLNAENVAEALRITGARMVDVSSSVESSPGIKDSARMQAFAHAVHEAERKLP